MDLHREEKRRGRKETEVVRRIKGGIKRRETGPASNQFPVFSTARNTQRDSQSWVEKRRDGGGDRGDLGEKKESQRERE